MDHNSWTEKTKTKSVKSPLSLGFISALKIFLESPKTINQKPKKHLGPNPSGSRIGTNSITRGQPIVEVIANIWVGSNVQVVRVQRRIVEWRLELKGYSEGLDPF